MSQSGLMGKLTADKDAPPSSEADAFSNAARVFHGHGPALTQWAPSAMPQDKITSVFDDETGISVPDVAFRHVASSGRLARNAAFLASVAWAAFVPSYYFFNAHAEFLNILASPLAAGGMASAILAPVACLWLGINAGYRRRDAQFQAEALRHEFKNILLPDSENSGVINHELKQLMRQAAEIAASSDMALKSIQRARQGLRAEIRDFSGVSQKTEFHIERLAETLSEQAENLLKITNQIQQRSCNITEEVQTGVEIWTEVSKEALDKLLEIRKGFEESTQGFEDQTLMLDAVSQTLSGRLAEMEDSFDAGVMRLESACVAGTQSFSGIVENFSDFQDRASNIIEQAEATGIRMAGQSETLFRSAEDIADKIVALQSGRDDAVRQIEEIIAAASNGTLSLEKAIESAEAQSHQWRIVVEDFGAHGRSLKENLAELSEQNQLSNRMMQEVSSNIAVAADRLELSTSKLRDVAEKPLSELDKTSIRIAEDVEKIQNGLSAQVRDLGHVAQRAADTGREIESRTDATARIFSQASTRLETAAQIFSDGFQSEKEKLADFIGDLEAGLSSAGKNLTFIASESETLNGRLTRLSEQSASVANGVSTTVDAMRSIASDVAPAFEKLAAQAERSRDALKDIKDRSHGLADDLFERLERLSCELENQMSSIQHGADAVDTVHSRVDLLDRRLEDHSNKLKTFQKTAQEAIVTSDELGMSLQNFDIKSQESAARVKSAGDVFAEETQRLGQTGEEILLKATAAASDAADRNKIIADEAADRLHKISRVNDAIAFQMQDIERYAGSASAKTSDYSNHLQEQVRTIAESSTFVAEKLGDCLDSLRREAEDTARHGEKMSGDIERASARLASGAEAILKSSETLGAKAQSLRDAQAMSGRDMFLTSARFVIESLHSLSIDIARHLDSEIDEKAWKAYRKGDFSAFTRKLVSAADQNNLETAKLKIAQDGEFRLYAQRFMSQFEDIFASAQKNDHGEMLGSIFISSDIGRLYRILCDISGREFSLTV